MSPASIAWRYLLRRPWVTALTLLSLALGSALPCVILQLRARSEASLLRDGEGVDLVVGGKGSPLQLVLSAVHHLDLPTGNIPLSLYETLRNDRRIAAAVPLSLGDNVRGFRIVGTDASMRAWRPRGFEGAEWLRLRGGVWFNSPFDAVAGAEAARVLDLAVGDSFVGAHGLVAAPGTEHRDFPYRVTGILEPTGGAMDRLILTPLESVWDVHAAEEKHHGYAASEARPPEVTALWLKLRSPGLRVWIREEINRKTEAMAASPVEELLRLYQRVLRPLERGLLWMAAAVAVTSTLAILATLLQAAERRRRDWALLRVLGAHPREVFLIVWMEAVWIALLGVFAGFLLAHGGLALAFHLIDEPGFASSPFWLPTRGEGLLLAGIALAASLTGLLPAALQYRRSPLTDLESA
jgi:putative ABC transport system permease protein